MKRLKSLERKYSQLIKEIHEQKELFHSHEEYIKCLVKYQSHINLVHRFILNKYILTN